LPFMDVWELPEGGGGGGGGGLEVVIEIFDPV
jgi:hypothetical protein